MERVRTRVSGRAQTGSTLRAILALALGLAMSMVAPAAYAAEGYVAYGATSIAGAMADPCVDMPPGQPTENYCPTECETLDPIPEADGAVICHGGVGSYRVVTSCIDTLTGVVFTIAGRAWVGPGTLSARFCQGSSVFYGPTSYYIRGWEPGPLGGPHAHPDLPELACYGVPHPADYPDSFPPGTDYDEAYEHFYGWAC